MLLFTWRERSRGRTHARAGTQVETRRHACTHARMHTHAHAHARHVDNFLRKVREVYETRVPDGRRGIKGYLPCQQRGFTRRRRYVYKGRERTRRVTSYRDNSNGYYYRARARARSASLFLSIILRSKRFPGIDTLSSVRARPEPESAERLRTIDERLRERV